MLTLPLTMSTALCALKVIPTTLYALASIQPPPKTLAGRAEEMAQLVNVSPAPA